MEGDQTGDEFARPSVVAEAADDTPTPEFVEIVGSAIEAKTTISPAAKAQMEANLYGDIPLELRPTQYAREVGFMTGSRVVEKFNSSHLPQPYGSIVLGTNGFMSFAIHCFNEKNADIDKLRTVLATPPPSQSRDDMAKTKMICWDMWSKTNMAFWFKFRVQSLGLERLAFHMAAKFTMDKLWLAKDTDLFIKHLFEQAEIDTILQEPADKLLEKAKVKRETMVDGKEGQPPKGWFMSAIRPPGAFDGVYRMESSSAQPTTTPEAPPAAEVPAPPAPQLPPAQFFLTPSPSPIPDTTQSNMYTLLYCFTPSSANPKTRWVETRITFKVQHATVPISAMNRTHLAILSQDRADDLMHLQFYRINEETQPYIKLESEYYFAFPKEFGNGGILYATLTEEGIYAVCLAKGVVVIDRSAVDQSPAHHLIVFCDPPPKEAPTAAEGGSKRAPLPPVPRVLTTCSVIGKNILLVGTNMGESYGVDFYTGQAIFSEHVPGLEPIHGILSRGDKHMMLTVMGVCIRNRFIDIPRPIAIDTCGTLLFALSKYGMIKVFSTIADAVARDLPPPENIAPMCPSFQLTYAAIKAFHDRVVVVYQDGLVHVVYLTEEMVKEAAAPATAAAAPAAAAVAPTKPKNPKTVIIKKKKVTKKKAGWKKKN